MPLEPQVPSDRQKKSHQNLNQKSKDLRRVSMPQITYKIGRWEFFLYLNLIISILFFVSPKSEGFDGSDRESPRVTEYKLLVRPTPENDWRIVFSLKTLDDKNIVNLPKFSFRVAFPWKPSSTSPAPKCLKGAQLEVALSAYEQMYVRVSDTNTVRQSFLVTGRIPPRPTLENSCPEFRDFSKPAIAAINGRGIITTFNKGSVIPNYSGSIFEPKLEDASGRIFDPKNPSNTISALETLPLIWPNKTMEICLNEASLGMILSQEGTFQTLTKELARAEELGNSADFSQAKSLLEAQKIALEVQSYIEGKVEDLSKFPLCPKMIQGSSHLSQVKIAINNVKRSNDDYIKAKENEIKKSEREAAADLAQTRNSRISLADEVLKTLNAEYAILSQSYSDLTKVSTVQSSTTSFGSNEKTKAKNRAVEERIKILEKITEENNELKKFNSEKIAIEFESQKFSDKLSVSFYQKLLSKYDQIRQLQMKKVVILLRFEQFYTRVAA
jgi:hypothetical protein